MIWFEIGLLAVVISESRANGSSLTLETPCRRSRRSDSFVCVTADQQAKLHGRGSGYASWTAKLQRASNDATHGFFGRGALPLLETRAQQLPPRSQEMKADKNRLRQAAVRAEVI
jgi:hypothetical protein